jgi:hypothetical protein
MTPQFLRQEAARFRGMADTVDREASKQRLLKMAIDYDAQANAAEEPAERPAEQPAEVGAPAEPPVAEAIKVKPTRKIAKELKETC